MTPERWAQIEELFHRVAECNAEQRGPLLDRACQDDIDLRREVDALLASDQIAGHDLSSVVRKELKDFAFPRVGQTISHFRIVNGLGGGGMGLVYKAEDLKLGRQVALKFLPEESAKDPAALGRFEREARSASSLEHPNICPVYEFVEQDGQPFLVMQLLEGRTLQELISEQGPGKSPFSVEKLVDLAIQIASALEAAHKKRIIHRDIKPSNIFVTSRGEPKILDFGLAKLYESDSVEQPPSSFETAKGWERDVTLTRAGTAIGTAAYMSPEQIRGEKLDARTDLFSFGLVLYEMAVGRRAFSEETGPQLREAILAETPVPVRQLNRALPTRIEAIVKKAIEKNRDERYQSAADLRSDLEALQKTIKRRSPHRFWILAAGALIAVLGIVTSLRIAKRLQSRSVAAPPNIKLRQLTFNSFENRVTSGAISPDGRFVAYADVNGMYVMTLQTGETRLIPEPDELRGKNVQWEIDAGSPEAVWFGDSASFVANAHLSTPDPSLWGPENTSVWVVNASHGAPHKIRDNSVAYAVASIRNQIAFTTREGRELWVMGPSGNEAHKIVERPATTPIIAAYWSPDAKQLIYGVEDHPDSPRVLSRDLQSGAEIELLSTSEVKNMQDVTWLPDGRMLYSVAKDSGDGCDYWTMRRDLKSGKTVEAPKQITNWSGFCMSGASATADGRELVFLKTVPGHMTSYVAEISEGGRRLRNLRHFPLSENSDAVADWMADNKEVLTVSNRTGSFGIYKQALDSETARPIVTEGYGREPHLTPDGKWVLFLGTGNAGESVKTNPQPLMRVSVNGGAPQRLSPSVPYGLLSCARAPARLCVLARPTDDRKQLIISSIDPLKGIGPELMRFPLDPNRYDWFLALSSDGTRLAVTRNESGPIYTFLVSGKPIDQINVKNWSNLLEFAWAVDGRGLYVVAVTRGGHTLLYVDPHGNAYPLWESFGANVETKPILSPDGRQIAVQTWTTNGNLWMAQSLEYTMQ